MDILTETVYKSKLKDFNNKLNDIINIYEEKQINKSSNTYKLYIQIFFIFLSISLIFLLIHNRRHYNYSKNVEQNDKENSEDNCHFGYCLKTL